MLNPSFVVCLAAFGAGSGLAWADPTESPLVLGAIGDSMTAGFNAEHLGDNRELSWATSTDPRIDSYAHRLEAATGRPVQTYNVAIAGSEIVNLPPQVDEVLARNPDFVTITIGANDVCAWTGDDDAPLTKFDQGLRAQLDRIIAARPAVMIVLSPIPDMVELWNVGVARGCQSRWDFWGNVGFCRALLADTVTAEQRDAFGRKLDKANGALLAISNDYEAHIVPRPPQTDTHFTSDDVSVIDCFHPSVAGQALLASRVWSSPAGD